jgi:hypothetical protein
MSWLLEQPRSLPNSASASSSSSLGNGARQVCAETLIGAAAVRGTSVLCGLIFEGEGDSVTIPQKQDPGERLTLLVTVSLLMGVNANVLGSLVLFAAVADGDLKCEVIFE